MNTIYKITLVVPLSMGSAWAIDTIPLPEAVQSRGNAPANGNVAIGTWPTPERQKSPAIGTWPTPERNAVIQPRKPGEVIIVPSK